MVALDGAVVWMMPEKGLPIFFGASSFVGTLNRREHEEGYEGDSRPGHINGRARIKSSDPGDFSTNRAKAIENVRLTKALTPWSTVARGGSKCADIMGTQHQCDDPRMNF